MKKSTNIFQNVENLGGPFLEIVGRSVDKTKANGRGALNPEYDPLSPNRLRDRAILPEHFYFGRVALHPAPTHTTAMHSLAVYTGG